MHIFKDLGSSTDRALDMGTHLGVDYGKLMMKDAELNALRFRRIVLRCNSCASKDNCQALLAATERLSEAPAYCPNKSAMRALQNA